MFGLAIQRFPAISAIVFFSANKKKRRNFSDDWYNRLRDTRKEINRVRCRMIRRVHARSQFVRSYTNVHVNRMTGSVRTGPPVTGVKVGAAGNKRGKKEDSISLFFVVGAIVAVLRGGSPRLNTASPWEASRRPLSLYNFNSRLDDFVRLTPFFSLLFLASPRRARLRANNWCAATWLFQADRRENVPPLFFFF